jgi:ABC-type sugar transport system substrate-binding protein
MKSKQWLLLLAFVIAGLALSACGGGGSSSSSESTEAASAEPAEAGGETKDASNEAGSEEGGNSEGASSINDPASAKNPITKPLSKKPPTGKKVVFLQCELPACERFKSGMEGATKALGWSLETIVFPSANPGKGLETALSQNPDYIAMSGVPQSVMKAQMATAEKQGVPIVSCSTVEQGKPGGYAAQCESTDINETEILAQWIEEDSGGDAHILGLTLPLYPILGTQIEYLEGEFLQNCSGCSYKSLNLTPENLAEGAVGQKVVAELQQNPEINYVYSTFADPTTGLRQVLDSAGYQEVKIVSAAGNETTVQEVPDKVAATTQTPNEFMSWQMVDALARISVGEDVQKDPEYQELLAETPVYVIDSEEAVERLKPFNYNWPGPGDGAYMQEFEELWQVK